MASSAPSAAACSRRARIQGELEAIGHCLNGISAAQLGIFEFPGSCHSGQWGACAALLCKFQPDGCRGGVQPDLFPGPRRKRLLNGLICRHRGQKETAALYGIGRRRSQGNGQLPGKQPDQLPLRCIFCLLEVQKKAGAGELLQRFCQLGKNTSRVLSRHGYPVIQYQQLAARKCLRKFHKPIIGKMAAHSGKPWGKTGTCSDFTIRHSQILRDSHGQILLTVL